MISGDGPKAAPPLASRRTFLTQLAGVLVAPAVAGLPRVTRARLGPIGIQTYSVRYLMAKEPAGTLAALSRIGYRQVELIKADVARPAEMRRLLDQNHLTAPSGHLTLVDMRQNWPLALDDAAIMGQSYIVCAWVPEDERTADGWKRIAAELNTLGESSRKHGIQLAYHNHSFEWTASGSVVPYEVLLTECDAKLVQMEIDIYHMVAGGQNPLTYFARYPGRFPLLHVKDMGTEGEMVDVGRGTIDFGAIFAKAGQGGVKYYFVEHDNPPDPIADAKVCYDYLRQLRF
jgi:sugar phosphate isomerase/epimerase